MTEERLEGLPDVPTFKEQGYETALSMALTEQLPVQLMFRMTFISIYVMNLQSFAAVMNLSRQ